MKLRTLLVINAVVLGGSGLGAVLMPARMCSLYGVALSPELTMMARYAGLGSIAMALIAWFSRNVSAPQAQRAIVLAFLITYASGVVISVDDTISGVLRIGWPLVVLYSLLVVGYAYFQFMKRPN